MCLIRRVDDSHDGLGATFSGLSVGPFEGKEKEKEKEAVEMGAEGVHPGHDPTDEVGFGDKPSESAPRASERPAAPSTTTSTLPASHPATTSATTIPPIAEGLGFTGVPYSTYGVDSFAAAPPMATAVRQPVASSSIWTVIRESMPHRWAEDYHRPATGVDMNNMPVYAAPQTGYTMPAPGFTSLSGLRGPVSCGGRSRGSGRSSNKSLTWSEIREGHPGATAALVGYVTQEIRAKLEPLIPP